MNSDTGAACCRAAFQARGTATATCPGPGETAPRRRGSRPLDGRHSAGKLKAEDGAAEVSLTEVGHSLQGFFGDGHPLPVAYHAEVLDHGGLGDGVEREGQRAAASVKCQRQSLGDRAAFPPAPCRVVLRRILRRSFRHDQNDLRGACHEAQRRVDEPPLLVLADHRRKVVQYHERLSLGGTGTRNAADPADRATITLERVHPRPGAKCLVGIKLGLVRVVLCPVRLPDEGRADTLLLDFGHVLHDLHAQLHRDDPDQGRLATTRPS